MPWKTDQYLEKSLPLAPLPLLSGRLPHLAEPGSHRRPQAGGRPALLQPGRLQPAELGAQWPPEPQSPRPGPRGQPLSLPPHPEPAAFGQMNVRGLRELGVGGEKQVAVTSQRSPGLNWADVSPEREESVKPHAEGGQRLVGALPWQPRCLRPHCVSSAGGAGSIPGWETGIPTCHAAWPKK